MKKLFLIMGRNIIIANLLLLNLSACGLQMANPELSRQGMGTTINNDSIRIGEAISYKNLQVFPVLSRSNENEMNYMVLSDAIQQQLVIVKETGSVNQLQIDNLSDSYIFILAGDIVKGGRQDRTMGNDVIVAPKARNVPLESYCVESGRWQQRGEEEAGHFSDNTKTLTSKDLKLASRYQKDQSEVWQKVSEEQEKLNRGLGSIKGEIVEVKSTESETSLQLTLENKELEDIVKEYKNNLTGLYHLSEEAVGFAYAINGKLYGIDIYNDSILFNSLKHKLFDAVIVEAISEFESGLNFTGISADSVVNFLNSFDHAEGMRTLVNKHTSVLTYETEKAVGFETRLADTDEKWVRKNYLVKGEKAVQGGYIFTPEQRMSE